MKTLLAVVLLFSLPAFLHPQGTVKGQPEIPGNIDLRQMLNRPSFIYSHVDSVKEGEKVWITMETDVQICTPLSLGQIRGVITDYNRYTRTFKRTTASHIVESNKQGIIAFFEVTVGALGITVVTAYSVLMESPIDSPEKFLLTFSHVSDNGSIRNVHGFWYLQAVTIDGQPHTYLRYYSYYEPLRVNMLQRQVTAWFIGAENATMVEEVLAAAALRPKF
ncbi:MAG: hypothetical protein LBO65_04865 [Spirochaetaceae bacterium]|nr:hypothetical protein [Spirochaetaceae bacterium]